MVARLAFLAVLVAVAVASAPASPVKHKKAGKASHKAKAEDLYATDHDDKLLSAIGGIGGAGAVFAVPQLVGGSDHRQAVPEPLSLIPLSVGAVSLWASRRRRRG